jgi:hypothetical protein
MARKIMTDDDDVDNDDDVDDDDIALTRDPKKVRRIQPSKFKQTRFLTYCNQATPKISGHFTVDRLLQCVSSQFEIFVVDSTNMWTTS